MYQTLKELFICQHESFDTFGIFHNVSEIYIYGYKFGSSEQRYRPLLLRIFESEENNCTLRKLLLLGCHCITNGFTIYKKRFLLRSIFFKGTVSQDYVFFFLIQKTRARGPPYEQAKTVLLIFLVFSKMFAKNVCPRSC